MRNDPFAIQNAVSSLSYKYSLRAEGKVNPELALLETEFLFQLFLLPPRPLL